MQKIMFNEKYGLETAVLDGTKPLTRRIAYEGEINSKRVGVEDNHLLLLDGNEVVACSKFAVGEEVAIAQSYSNLREVLAKRDFKRTDALYDKFYRALQMGEVHDGMNGWGNKMFVKAELMPHRIRITNIRVERLQDITEADILKEGIKFDAVYDEKFPYFFTVQNKYKSRWNFPTAQLAFSTFIDRVSGKGTWDKNPWVFVYEFEVVK